MDSVGNCILENFVTVEGIDGAGTTTQTSLISAFLRKRNIPHFPTREPTDGPIGRFIREVLTSIEPISGTAFSLLFAADRAEHCYRPGGIIEHHAAGDLIISDRYLASSLAYQSLEVPVAYVETINNTVPLPSRVIFLTTPVSVCQKRVRTRNRITEKFDDASIQSRVFSSYDSALKIMEAKGVEVHRIDGSGTKEEVFERLQPVLEIR